MNPFFWDYMIALSPLPNVYDPSEQLRDTTSWIRLGSTRDETIPTTTFRVTRGVGIEISVEAQVQIEHTYADQDTGLREISHRSSSQKISHIWCSKIGNQNVRRKKFLPQFRSQRGPTCCTPDCQC